MPLTALARRDGREPPARQLDVRGWTVRTLMDDEAAGTVDALVLDAAGSLRYLDIARGEARPHVLLAVGHARADPWRSIVWVPGLGLRRFRDLPAYDREPDRLTRAHETALLAAYRSAYAGESGRPRTPYAGAVSGPQDADAGGPGAALRLAPLADLEAFRIADGEPDPRGWSVVAGDGRRIGRVDALLVDTRALKVRLLSCRVDEDALELSREDRHVLIPVGYARLDQTRPAVLVDAITSGDVERMPVYRGEDVTRELVDAVSDAYSVPDDAFYRRPSFDRERFDASSSA